MKATGIVRRVDDLGRIVVPKEIRTNLSIDIGDPVEFYVDGDCVVVKKYDAVGSVEQLLDNIERSIRMKGDLLTPAQCGAIIGKMEEMKEIIKSKNN
jgi:transcriptional pleiotropic regulator of transition state genes